MKRLTLSLFGFAFLLAASPAHALTPLCEQILELDPMGGEEGYVAKVLERSNTGMEEAREAVQAPDFDAYLSSWAQNVGSTFLLLIDNQLTLGQQSQDLTQNTACLHQDVMMIQCQIDKVKDEMNEAFIAGSVGRIQLLQPQIPFLRERLQYLLRGAADPSFADPTWGLISAVDPTAGEYWCCEGSGNECVQSDSCQGQKFYTLDGCIRSSMCTAPAGESGEDSRMCPFHTDYAPPLKAGYGCWPEKMGEADYLPLRAERDALNALIDDVNEEASALAAEAGSDGGTSTQVLPPELKELAGCYRKYGYCDGDKFLGCSDDADCETRDAGECVFDLPTDAAWEGLRTAFSLDKDEVGIIAEFLQLKEQEGYSRKQPTDLKTVDEFSSQESSMRSRRSGASFIESTFRATFRTEFRGWSRAQGNAEVGPFAQAGDSQLTMIKVFPSTGVARELRRLVTDSENGVRAFIERYAYFARRTCMNRPCSKQLEQILRINYTDECFPYANGAFRAESEDEPNWQKCAEQACIPVDGVELDDDYCVCYKTNMGDDLQASPAEVSASDDPDVCFPRP